MALNRVDYPANLTDQADFSAHGTLIETGYLDKSFAPLLVLGGEIPQGIVLQIGGVVYRADSAETVTGSSSKYIRIVPAGATATANYVANLSGVSWNAQYNGYYDGSGNLYIFDENQALYDGAVATVKTRFMNQTAEGDVFIGRDLKVKKDLQVDGDVDVVGNVDLGGIFQINGSISANGAYIKQLEDSPPVAPLTILNNVSIEDEISALNTEFTRTSPFNGFVLLRIDGRVTSATTLKVEFLLNSTVLNTQFISSTSYTTIKYAMLVTIGSIIRIKTSRSSGVGGIFTKDRQILIPSSRNDTLTQLWFDKTPVST